ncbi:MAG: UvrABC system protein [Chlamydiota bacterium]|jgi:excinuclease ABC subunit C
MEEKILKTLSSFPDKPGVYLMKNKEGKVIYVGKAKNLRTRIKQYFLYQDTRAMVPFLVKQTESIDTIVVPSEKEALLLENTLIKQHLPKFNAVLKDDKSFLSLEINPKDPWPRLCFVRSKSAEKKEGLVFGPYTSAFAAKKTHELLSKLFPLRQCSDEEFKRRTRPCLLYSIKRCLGPCVNRCTKEEYDFFVQGAIRFLKGENKEILKELYLEMDKASEALLFEKAAGLLRTIRQMEHVIDSESLVCQNKQESYDALGIFHKGSAMMIQRLLFRKGQLVGSESYSFDQILEDEESLLSSFILQMYSKQQGAIEEILLPIVLPDADLLEQILSIRITTPKKGDKRAFVKMAEENAKLKGGLSEDSLVALQTQLHLSRYPHKIACIDTSHIGGSNPVSALVVFTEGKKDKKQFRLFKIRSSNPADDYGALKEVLTRYLTKAQQALPDLLIIDGGKGQLNTAMNVLKELDIIHIDVIAVTKEEGRHDKGMTQERVFLPGQHDPIHLNPRSSLLFLLQNIRDEAHRSAISFHRRLRAKKQISSALLSVPGIGPIKQKRLLQHFGSLEQIKQASKEELKKVKGITDKDIAHIKQGT